MRMLPPPYYLYSHGLESTEIFTLLFCSLINLKIIKNSLCLELCEHFHEMESVNQLERV